MRGRPGATPVLTINSNGDDDDVEVIEEETVDVTRDIGDGGDDTNGEDSMGEDSHDFQISGGNLNHECTLLTSPGKGQSPPLPARLWCQKAQTHMVTLNSRPQARQPPPGLLPS